MTGALVSHGGEDSALLVASGILIPLPTYLVVQRRPESHRILLLGSVSILIVLFAAEIVPRPHCTSICVSHLKHYESLKAFHDQLDAQKIQTRCMRVCLSTLRGKGLVFHVFFKLGNSTV